MNTPEQIAVAYARSLKNAPWRHRGRKPWGVDCVGLMILSLHAAGHPIVDEKQYGREPWDDLLRRRMREELGEPIWVRGNRFEIIQPGDMALIRWDKREPSHVAVIGDYQHGGLSLIHSENIRGVVEHSLSGNFLNVLEEVYRPWPVKSSR